MNKRATCQWLHAGTNAGVLGKGQLRFPARQRLGGTDRTMRAQG